MRGLTTWRSNAPATVLISKSRLDALQISSNVTTTVVGGVPKLSSYSGVSGNGIAQRRGRMARAKCVLTKFIRAVNERVL